MTLGTDNDTTIEDEYFENLAFYCYDGYGSDKLEYYKEYLQRQETNDDDIVEPEKVTIPIETLLSGPPMNSPWPMQCYNKHHTSQSPYSTTHIDGLEKWRFKTDSGIDGSPIIGNDGTVFIGSTDRNIYALYPNGTLKWKFQTSDYISSAPALADDGTLYVGSWDEKLYAFNSTNGEKNWVFRTDDGAISSSPAIGKDGTIYFGTLKGFDEGEIIAVNPNGTKKWIYPTGYYITSDPAIGEDGTIYIGSGDSYLYAMNPDGTLKWRTKTGDYVKGPPSIAEDGTVYIGSFDDYLYALNPTNGSKIWKCKVGYGTETNPSIASDGTIYIGGEKLYAIYPNGTKRWAFNLGEGRHIHKSCPAISSDGTIYVGTNIGEVSGGDIIAVNPDGTERWRKKIVTNEWVDSSPCIGLDGTVYIGSWDAGRGYLHAFGPIASNNPPKTPNISGEKNGKAGEEYWYGMKTDDPENNPVSYYIEWGDGKHTGWTTERASGEKYYYKHKWSEEGNYTIRCKAKDVLGEESDWGYLEVNMPRTRVSSYLWYEWFLERFLMLDQLLNLL